MDFPLPETPVTTMKLPRGNSTVTILEIVFARAVDDQLLTVAVTPSRGRVDPDARLKDIGR